MKLRVHLLCWAVACVFVTSASYAQDTTGCSTTVAGARIVSLGSLYPDESDARGINDWGQVVGWSTFLNPPVMEFRGFLWRADTGMQDLLALGAPIEVAYDINDRSEILGFSWAAGGMLVWTPQAGATLMPDGVQSVAFNDLGHLAGTYLKEGAAHGFYWTGRSFTDLGTLGGRTSYANALNNHGQVVGVSETPSGERRPFIWSSRTGMQDLGGPAAVPSAINDIGEVVGQSPSGTAVMWNRDGSQTDLGALGIYTRASVATDINDLSQVVGISALDDGVSRAFVWTAQLGMRDLGTLGGGICEAGAARINNRGEIVGWSRTPPDSRPRAFKEAVLWEIPLSTLERLAGVRARLETLSLAGRIPRARLRVMSNHVRAAERSIASGGSGETLDVHLRSLANDIAWLARSGALAAWQANVLLADISRR